MNADTTEATLKAVSLAASGEPYKLIALKVGRTPNVIYKHARKRGVPRRLPSVSPLARKQILALLMATNMSYAGIARLVRVSKATVGRVAKHIRHRQMRRLGEFQPEESKAVKRCPIHGLVNVWPCVACAADQNRARSMRG